MRMPVLFVGHGSPMNAIEENEFTATWAKLGENMPRPKGILAVSAHWYTSGTRTSDQEQPETIYDMYGFPKELYEKKYPVKGSKALADQVMDMLPGECVIDNHWGIDHGTWSVLCHMYPEADIPVVQLSINHNAPAAAHYQLGKDLADLREEGILILGSGNVVHNLSLVDWNRQGGFPWAETFDSYIKEKILARNYDDVVNYSKVGDSAKKAFYTPEHFYPLLYVLGAAHNEDKITVFNEACVLGALSMTGYLFE